MNSKELSLIYKCIFLGAFYSLVWTFSDLLQGVDFGLIRDRTHYLDYASFDFASVLDRLSDGLVFFIFNEPLFFLIASLCGAIFNSDTQAIRFIIFVISFIAAYYCYNRTNNLFLTLLILFFSQIYGNYVMSLRQGTALAFLLLGIMNFRLKGFFYILCTPFIHNSFFLILLIYIVCYFYAKFNFRLITSICISLIINLIIFSIVLKLAAELGLRQAADYDAYGGVSDQTSGIGFLFWIIIFIIYTFGIDFSKLTNNSLELRQIDLLLLHFSLFSIIFYLFTYYYSPPLSRLIQNCALIIFSLSIYLRPKYAMFFKGIMSMNLVVLIKSFFSGGILVGFIG